jgi:hypothetical protein
MPDVIGVTQMKCGRCADRYFNNITILFLPRDELLKRIPQEPGDGQEELYS